MVFLTPPKWISLILDIEEEREDREEDMEISGEMNEEDLLDYKAEELKTIHREHTIKKVQKTGTAFSNTEEKRDHPLGLGTNQASGTKFLVNQQEWEQMKRAVANFTALQKKKKSLVALSFPSEVR